MALASALALIPIAVNTLADPRIDDCANPSVLIPRSTELDPARVQAVVRVFESFAWREGTLPASADHPELHYSILRSWDPKKLYYRPDYGMIRKLTPTGRELEWIEADGESLPIHVPLYPGRNPRVHVGAYVLIYAGKLVAHPIPSQLLAAPRQMFLGRYPMTLYFVWAFTPRAQREATEAQLRQWLAESWREYQQICSS